MRNRRRGAVRIRRARADSRPVFPAFAAVFVAACLALHRIFRAKADDRIEYRYEDYQEDAGRIHVRTQTAYFESQLTPYLTLKGDVGYDGISGATPTGGPPPPGSSQVPMVPLYDNRYSGGLGADWQSGRYTTSPGFSYSSEHDYESYGASLNERIDFNGKNTTLALGVSHDFDKLNGFYQPDWVHKSSTEWLVGVTQLLSPKTVFQANVTLGYSSGYLTDPYKGVNFFYAYPFSFYDPANSDTNFGESRPGHRFKQILFLSLTHYLDRLNAAAEVTYRFHHDDWGIFDHTFGLSWRQKVWSRLTVSPLFRYYRQTAATFYSAQFAGDPIFPDGAVGAAQSDGFTILFKGDPTFPGDAPSTFTVPAHPAYYSSDYRLSEMETFTFGAQADVKLSDSFTINLAFKRYVMRGLDGVTPQSAYPKANIASIGATIWF
jgi:Protein of unknown function (DUF3570)